MSDQMKSPMEVPRSTGVGALSVEDELAKLKSDVDRLKTESRSWVKTWGVYLGMLGALIAVPKGALDLVTELWQRPDTSVAIKEVTIYHDPGLTSEILQFPLVVMNLGNRDDVLLNNGATLSVAGQSVDLSEADFGLFDNGNKIKASLLAPKNATRAYDVSVTFNPKTREVAAMPGPHKLELRFLGVKDQSYLASFCFPLQASDVHELFESSVYQHQKIITQCPGRD
jgi:hypothetical protein